MEGRKATVMDDGRQGPVVGGHPGSSGRKRLLGDGVGRLGSPDADLGESKNRRVTGASLGYLSVWSAARRVIERGQE